MATSGTKFLGIVLGVLVTVVIVVAAAWLVVGGGGWSAFSSPAKTVRPWAEADYDAVMAPVATADAGSHARFQRQVRALERIPDKSDPTKLRLEIVAAGSTPEAWVPAYNVHRMDAAGGFAFSDGERSGETKYVGARTLAAEFVEDESPTSGYLELSYFSPAMEPLDKAGRKSAGVEEHDLSVWTQFDEPITGIRVGLVVEGYDDVKWQLRGFYDRRTKVRLANGGGWTSSGNKGRFETDLHCVHDAEVRLVADFCHGPVQRFPLVLGDGEVAEGDDFRVEIVGLVNGTSRSSGSSGDGRETRYSHRIDKLGGDSTTAVFLISPDVADDAITIEAIGKDGKVLKRGSNGSSESFRKSSWDAKPEEIERFEVVYRPNYERLLVDLPPLAGVPVANTGVSNLFDCVIPLGEVKSEWKLRQAIAQSVQLKLGGRASSSSGAMTGVFPLDISGMTVSEVLDVYARARPELTFRVDPVGMVLEIDGAAVTTWWGGVFEKVKGWF